MKHLRLFSGLAAGTTALAAAAAAFAQDLPLVGRPVPQGIAFQPPATEIAERLQWLDHFVLYIITAIVIFVTALLIWVMVRYSQRANPKPASFTHNTPLEVIWTILPVFILVVIGAYSLPQLFHQQEIPVADVTIKATGNQWYWSYEYPDEGVSFDSYMIGAPANGGDNRMTPEVEAQLKEAGYSKSEFLLATDTAVVIPVNKTIVVEVTGADVIHSWKIPAFGVMQDGVPGRLAHLWFKAEKEGIYFGQCSELCGQSHAYMPITVKVVSEAAYAKWLESAKAGNVILSDAMLQEAGNVQVAAAD